MVKMLEIREMLRLVDQSSLEKLEVLNGGFRISVKKGATTHIHHISESMHHQINIAEGQISTSFETAENLVDKIPHPHVLQSQFVGKFQPLLRIGDKVEIGSLMGHCCVTALKLNHEIISDINGVIEGVLVEAGHLIDYGQPLYKVAVRKEFAHV